MLKTLNSLLLGLLLCGSLAASSISSNPNFPAPKSELFSDDLICLDNEFEKLYQIETEVQAKKSTYSLMSSEQNNLTRGVIDEKADLASILLGASAAQMEKGVKITLIIAGAVVIIACGCLLLSLASQPQ